MKLIQRLALRYYKTKFRVWTALSKKKAAEKAFQLFCTPQSRNRKKIPKIFESAEKLELMVEGIIVRGWRFNHPGTKTAMILHGFESSVINFDRYIKPLIKKGYEVLAFDAPAHGRSGGTKINAPLFKKTILEINKKYGPVTSFMAHSFGGLALALALEDISHDEHYRVALVAPATETTTAISSFFKFLDLDPALRPEFEKVIIKAGGLSSSWYSVKRAMRNIRASVLWFHDEDDDTTPLADVLKVKEQNYPNIRFVFTKGLGHRRIYRDNKVTKAIIDFL
jgi:pimeloyl-ACP methyl ester carboxylesterase